MQSDIILEKVIQTIQSTLGTGPLSLQRQTRAQDVRGWDSLSHTVILVNLEENFNCQIPLERLAGLKNVGDLADLVAASLAPTGKKFS